MLLSLAYVLLLGMLLGKAAGALKLPPLTGMIFAGILLSPHTAALFGLPVLVSDSLLGISADLRRIALLIILTRAGLNLNIRDLKKAGRPAVFLCFLPALCEITGMVLLAPGLLHLSLADAALLGTVIAAVSPAVVVPRMLRLMEEGYGTGQSIPQMIMAGASVDDIFVIVLFACCTNLSKSGSFQAETLLRIPTSILSGIAAGLAVGWGFGKLLKKYHAKETTGILLFLALSFLFVTVEDAAQGVFGFSGLLGVMCMGIMVSGICPDDAAAVSAGFSKLWSGAEILLFVLVGITMDLKYALSCGGWALLAIAGVLVFRMTGVWLCTLGTKLSRKERFFCMIAYCPKATVQAAIGSVPLAMGLSCGSTILTVAVLSILLTAPIGAFAIDSLYKRLLVKQQ